MKKADFPSILCNFLLSALISVSGIFCAVTAYDFSWNAGRVIGLVLLFSAITCVLSKAGKALWLLLPLLLLSGRQLWLSDLEGHTENVIWYVSVLLERAYDTGFVLWWTGNNHLHHDTTTFFLALGMICAVVTGLSISKNRIIGAVFMGIFLLLPSMLLTDQTPEPLWLLALLTGLLCLLLSQHIRRADPGKATRFTLQSFVCSVVLVSFLTVCFPPDSYIAPEFPQLQQWIDGLQNLWPTDPPPVGTTPDGPGTSPFVPNKVDLGRVSAKNFSYRHVFAITASESGWQYLREASYVSYTGEFWYSDNSKETFAPDSFLLEEPLRLSLDTYKALKTVLTPYYQQKLSLDGGRMENDQQWINYTMEYRPLVSDWQIRWQGAYGNTSVSDTTWDVDQDYLELPDSTRQGAAVFLEQIGLSADMNVLDAANAIGNYVRSSASYSLKTKRMPNGEADFALWFLEEAETGYCIHFATAATVLLRSAGIPARYTTGYLVKTTAGMERIGYVGNAHAWVEYWLPGFGWMVLEVTPSSTEPEPTEPSTLPTTLPPEPTTLPTTLPTEPSTAPTTKPTLPTEVTTRPSVPSGPSGTDPGGPGGTGAMPPWLRTALRYILLAALVTLLLLLQWRLRLGWLYRRLHRGSPNAQALAHWRHACFLARLRKEAPPKQLKDLAKKAKFSQHTLTSRELRQFSLYRAETIDLLRRRNWLLRICYRLILAIY